MKLILRSRALFGKAKTPGSIAGVDVSTVTTSRKVYPKVSGAISVEAGLEYEKNGSGTWTSTAGTLTTSDYYRVRLTSSASYSTAVALDVTVDGVAYTFTVTTMADPTTYLYFGADNVVFGADDVTF